LGILESSGPEEGVWKQAGEANVGEKHDAFDAHCYFVQVT